MPAVYSYSVFSYVVMYWHPYFTALQVIDYKSLVIVFEHRVWQCSNTITKDLLIHLFIYCCCTDRYNQCIYKLGYNAVVEGLHGTVTTTHDWCMIVVVVLSYISIISGYPERYN